MFVLEKMAASIQDTEEATATAFKIILAEKVCQNLASKYTIVLNGVENRMGSCVCTLVSSNCKLNLVTNIVVF